MLSIEKIKTFYPERLHHFDRFLFREYLQHKILEIVFESGFGSKLCFLGGTCLRIVHDNQRFSEDLDFDNLGLEKEDFERVVESIKRELEREGYTIEIRNVFRGAFHCFIKFPYILYENKLSGHRDEKVLIKLDAQAQRFSFQPETYILNKFDVFTPIYTTPLDILLAQKLFTICNRPRPKGRDFFDVTFLLPRTKPSYDYLTQKMEIRNGTQLREKILMACENINFDDMVADVRAFLFYPKDEKKIKLFTEYFKQVELD